MIRYGLGSFLIVLGVVLLIVSPGGFGVEGFGLSAGAGSSVLMLNFLFRLGVAGEKEREREEDARRFLAEHGRWPNDGELSAGALNAAEQQPQPGAGHAANPPSTAEPQPGAPVQPAGRQPAGHDHRPGRAPDAGEHGGRRTGLSRDFSRRRRRG